MTLRKIFALLMALVMTAALLSACGDPASAPNVSSADDSEAQNADAENTALLTVNGEPVDTDGLVMMTIDGLEIPFDEFRYFYKYLDMTAFSNGDPTYWDSNPSAFDVLKQNLEYMVLENNWGNLLALKYNIEMTDEDLAEVETYMDEQRGYFESDEEFQSALAESSISEDLLRRIIAGQVLSNRVYEELYLKDGAPLAPSDDEIRETLTNDYVRVYHVLVTFDHFSGLDGYVDAALDYANQLLGQIQDGADIYELAQAADDPGMIDNEDGYFFTYGEMVEPFEEASFALQPGELSGIVETSYGYHIILRLEQDQYIEDNWDTVRGDYINTVFNENTDEMLENAEIVYWDQYDSLTPDSIG